MLNKYEFRKDYVIGYTSKGEKFYIDKEDYNKIKDYNWCYQGKGYIYNNQVGSLHRFIMGVDDDNYVVDHKDSNGLNNRKYNLRKCNIQENCMNKKNVKGYSYNKKSGKYIAKMRFNYKHIHIGSYKTEDEARFAYCEKAIELFGEFVSDAVVKDYKKLNKKVS